MPLKAKVHIETALWNERTILKNSICHSPFKVVDVTEDKRQKELKLMVMSSSPGILDGDDYHFDIVVSKNCNLVIETQSYQRIFQMKKEAMQTMVINMEEGASFTYLPHPVVPHAASSFTSRNKIYLANECSLVWGEVISCGRHLNQEVFQFSSFRSVTEIFLHGKLVVKENLLLLPMQNNLRSVGQLEGYTHQATLMYLNEQAQIDKLVNLLIKDLQQIDKIEFGVSALPVNGLMVRLLGYKAEQLFLLLKHLSRHMESTSQQIKAKPVAHV
jgi:urease accessory protein